MSKIEQSEELAAACLAACQNVQTACEGGEDCCTENVPSACEGDDCCIVVDKVGIRYGSHVAMKDVSLRIRANKVTAIVGPSGCGKSSFLYCLNRLNDMVPNCEVSGCISFDFFQGAAAPDHALRRQIGMLFQKPNPFPFSIWRNLEFPLMQHGVKDKAELAAKIERALMDVGLWDEVKDKLHKPALTLSGGQQQRLCLARALILQPSVLLMDEPCSALDPLSTRKIEELIRSLSATITIILVTHNMAQARRVADYVALFWSEGNSGRLLEYGTAREVFDSPKSELTRSYLAFA
ncbi:phosphate ABC transporter ATP-binding protein [Massilia sp. Dwa41.01b]|uniref:phosphate ABC transporter ATP-binding protein n=1 Tax=unclassified Massilia TaxID=2609279 RepID=UPI001603624D|nr:MULTISPECIES: phosphate ABC transporter ATP-binding protein [unclassified Massilia]QNA87268.1 phosphate ABC transporter ATP-binding protein [Massilia sp. Dwa41.01b]QNA98173.1 phosphate ABC transporter ATP-binding protein [Massilia sp. Se16.2.3]